jgi:hypothetical protein
VSQGDLTVQNHAQHILPVATDGPSSETRSTDHVGVSLEQDADPTPSSYKVLDDA